MGLAMRLVRGGVVENGQAFGVGGHQAVLDAVVYHLDEVAGAVRAAVVITFFGSSRHFVAGGRALIVAAAGRAHLENRIEALHDTGLATNHTATPSHLAPFIAT